MICFNPLELVLLQHAQQFHLQRRSQFPDLVEKHDAALGYLEPALFLRDRSGERPSLVPEQITLQQRLRDRRAVDRDKRLAASWTVAMQGAGGEFFAGTTLSPSISTVDSEGETLARNW